MGPGPSDVPANILAAMSRPTIGHLDPEFLKIMDQIKEMTRSLLGTTNQMTMPMSGTGSAGMETVFVNLIEPGDKVLVCVNGVFGGRMVDVAERCGATVTVVPGDWGRAFTIDQIKAVANADYKIIAIVHAETSTGVLQDLTGLRELADAHGALLLVDAVTSVGGLAVEMDKYGIDALYTGTQKCLSCPPGLAPISLSDRAVSVLENRSTKVASWYLDLSMIRNYWGDQRSYHHTAPINMLYALHEALRTAVNEGLVVREARHRLNADALGAGLEAMGLTRPVPANERLPPLTVVTAPEGINEGEIRKILLSQYNVEIGGGLGALKGKVWRIGLMGAASTRKNVNTCLSALAGALRQCDYFPPGNPIAAADAVYLSNKQ
jgi:alanine-glyoxylate transaminase/serine-glyoxylate transaminase/serine-pyruvate transaminase